MLSTIERNKLLREVNTNDCFNRKISPLAKHHLELSQERSRCPGDHYLAEPF